MKSLLRVVIAAALVTFGTIAAAEYPNKPVKVINPYSVGGTGDIAARMVAQKISEQTGKPWIVENRTGAGGRIGFNAAAKSQADGYTLASTDASYVILDNLYPDLPWDATKDLVPVAIYARNPFVILVSAKSKFSNLRDLVAYASLNPGKVNYGSAGVGSVNHILGEMFAREARIELTHVPYKGMGDAMSAMLTGTIELLITSMPTVIGPVKSGRVMPLAVTALNRSPAMPNVPTATEAGVPLVAANWFGFTAPKGTPKEIIDYVHKEIEKVAASQDVKERLAAMGAETSYEGPEKFARVLSEDRKRWGDVIRAANIKVE